MSASLADIWRERGHNSITRSNKDYYRLVRQITSPYTRSTFFFIWKLKNSNTDQTNVQGQSYYIHVSTLRFPREASRSMVGMSVYQEVDRLRFITRERLNGSKTGDRGGSLATPTRVL